MWRGRFGTRNPGVGARSDNIRESTMSTTLHVALVSSQNIYITLVVMGAPKRGQNRGWLYQPCCLRIPKVATKSKVATRTQPC